MRYLPLIVLVLIALSLSAQINTEYYSFCPNSPIVKDHEGNVYRTVQIGTQCWMAENMRCKSSPTGNFWMQNPVFSAAQPMYSAYYATPTEEKYGLLYNWAAAMDINFKNQSQKSAFKNQRGICPLGWHIPNISEWEELFSTLGGNSIAGESMKATSMSWEPQSVYRRNIGGFDATPAGAYTENGYKYYGLNAYFWSSISFSRSEAWCAILYDFKSEIYNYLDYKCYGHSVRCIRDY